MPFHPDPNPPLNAATRSGMCVILTHPFRPTATHTWQSVSKCANGFFLFQAMAKNWKRVSLSRLSQQSNLEHCTKICFPPVITGPNVIKKNTCMVSPFSPSVELPWGEKGREAEEARDSRASEQRAPPYCRIPA